MDQLIQWLNATDSSPCTRHPIKPSLSYLGPLWSPSFLFSLAPALQSRSRRNLSLALSRFIGVDLHGEESSVAIHRTERFSTCANLKCTLPSFLFVQLKFLVYGHTHTDRHTHTSCNAVTLVWGSLRLTPINIVSSKQFGIFAYIIVSHLHIIYQARPSLTPQNIHF